MNHTNSTGKHRTRIHIPVITIMVAALAVVFSWHYLFTAIPSIKGASSLQDPRQMVYTANEGGRFVVVPDAKRLYKNLLKNNKMSQLVQSRVGKDYIASPPLSGYSHLFELAGILPETLKVTAFTSLLPGPYYYGSDQYGYTLVTPLTRAAAKVLKAKTNKNTRVYENWFIYSSRTDRLEKQVEILKQSNFKPTEISKNLKNHDITVFIDHMARPQQAKTTGEKDLFFAFYKTLFAADNSSYQVFYLDADNKGLKVRATLALSEDASQAVKQYLSQNNGTVKGTGAGKQKEKPGLVFETVFDMPFLEQWTSSQKIEHTKGTGNTIFALYGLIDDYEILLPEVAVTWHGNDQNVTRFLEEAFKFSRYDASGSTEKQTRIKFIRAKYGKREYLYHFRPVLSKSSSKDGKKSFTTTLEVEKNQTKHKLANALIINRLLRQAKGRVTGALHADLSRIQVDIAVALKRFRPRYYPGSYGDFRESFETLGKHLTNASLYAVSSYHNDSIDTQWCLDL